ncbi:ROK family protein [Agromyces cerinus]|uniref:Glucokinase n=1 Tax=Agromyces cerinus subsp. cerinus TaxID=232089 RepID=A0A1N6HML1_9MICO|nr:ROK family protein [Agromyces cerinus]SIO21010.1 glucokinase [Agromyces cerinus subsp. cerinus]
MTRNLIPTIELGGTHVAVAVIDTGARSIVDGTYRTRPLDSGGDADEILEDIAAAARTLGSDHGRRWAVAVPGPFDLAEGIARYSDVGKFDALHGIDLRARLADALEANAISFTFVNDADAFALGEHAAGAARGLSRFCCVTLGTGVGSGWVVAGERTDGAAPGGELHLLEFEGQRIEARMSRRAIRAAYARQMRLTAEVPDVREIAELARSGDPIALEVLEDAFSYLGRALADPLGRFDAEALVIGGTIARSWDLLEAPLSAGLGRPGLPVIRAELSHEAPMIGAAYAAQAALAGSRIS